MSYADIRKKPQPPALPARPAGSRQPRYIESARAEATEAWLRRLLERQRMLREELADFRSGYLEESGGIPGAWVPLRMLPVTGLIAWELYRAGMIELAGDCARPAGRGL